ncbi:hypothetical protein [uncultured Aquimarina sp.]|uniref:hypothetical protein n=1 Tax=uncultured Aquimarina sp. TaxID=575652 RepID=UPI002609910A|nr:hypothetical protein [uncultured Aquimarina sp.]
MMKYYIKKVGFHSFVALIIFGLILTGCESNKDIEEKITSEELITWKTLGKGKTSIQHQEFIMEEIDSSDGLFLISPKNYQGDMVLQYKIKALSEASVLIVLFSASDSSETLQLTIPPENSKNEDIWKWRREMNHYNLTFNNKSHGYTPFFYKNISSLEREFHLRKQDNIMIPNQWVTVEIGKEKGKVWFSLNDDIVFEHKDTSPLLGGHIIFRISGGTIEGKNILAKASIKDLTIHHQ